MINYKLKMKNSQPEADPPLAEKLKTCPKFISGSD